MLSKGHADGHGSDSREKGKGKGKGKRSTHPTRRHIRLVNGQFEMTRTEREYAIRRKNWWQKWRTDTHVERGDLLLDNYIRSSRYTIWNFLPKNLYEQLMPHLKPANFYFLVISCLQSIREISTTGGRPSILVPLVFVLGVTAVKDAQEDYQRHKQDRITNQATYLVYRNSE